MLKKEKTSCKSIISPSVYHFPIKGRATYREGDSST